MTEKTYSAVCIGGPQDGRIMRSPIPSIAVVDAAPAGAMAPEDGIKAFFYTFQSFDFKDKNGETVKIGFWVPSDTVAPHLTVMEKLRQHYITAGR